MTSRFLGIPFVSSTAFAEQMMDVEREESERSSTTGPEKGGKSKREAPTVMRWDGRIAENRK